MDQLFGALLRGEPALDLAVLLGFVALAPFDGVGLEGLQRLDDVADLVGAGGVRHHAVHVPFDEAQNDVVEVCERLRGRPAEDVAEHRRDAARDDHGKQRREQRGGHHGAEHEGDDHGHQRRGDEGERYSQAQNRLISLSNLI
jgi:hypothetical protein